MITINEIAKRAGVRSSTVRFYERRGLIVPADRARNGYRLYDDGNVRTLLFTVRARALGLTVNEIKIILALVHSGEMP
jgi:MerR family Zn(II)-responsive transcriptional regulator of zntA